MILLALILAMTPQATPPSRFTPTSKPCLGSSSGCPTRTPTKAVTWSQNKTMTPAPVGHVAFPIPEPYLTVTAKALEDRKARAQQSDLGWQRLMTAVPLASASPTPLPPPPTPTPQGGCGHKGASTSAALGVMVGLVIAKRRKR